MLTQLAISNFAIISHLEINFRAGLNILSGETGAGKSIIINAVNLILGSRASTDLIRSGAEEARVEALFSIPDNPSINSLLNDLGIPFNGELIIKRTISRQGRNMVWINGSLATLQMLSRIGLQLISISGQHEHQLLLRPDNHLYLLDDFGGLSGERMDLRELYGDYQSLREELLKLEIIIRDHEERQELARFQMEEIEKADISPGEDAHLEDEKKRLRYAEQLKLIVTESYQMLYENEASIISDISLCIKKMDKVVEIDQRLEAVRGALASVRVELEEASLELRGLQGKLIMDPRRLEEVEDRLQLLNKLKRKYGATLENVMDFRDKISKSMESLDQQREEQEKINKRLEGMGKDIIDRATNLSKKRKGMAKRLENALKNELNLLDMEGTRFEVRFHEESVNYGDGPGDMMGAMKADGLDRVEFMLSPNIGEELRPLSLIASGGELSRIMLAMKTILARTASVESVVFDEVDAGIGGATAETVGEKLHDLAEYHQILCITHLPQIASKGKTHFLVKKMVENRRTQTIISELDPDERVEEIARLLGGRVISQKAVAHAREMLGSKVVGSRFRV